MHFVYLFSFTLKYNLTSQNHAINWILGYGINNDTSLYGRTILNFSDTSVNLTRNSGGFKFELGFENNFYSDNQGKLRFFMTDLD